jgi:16S rRNA (guanine1207-N2)-methyltransferase
MSSSSSSYYQIRAFSARLADQTVQVIAKPGMADWDRVSPAHQLLAEVARPAADARVLLLGCGHGALGVVLARRAREGAVVLLDTNWIALAMAERTRQANAVANANVCTAISVLPEQAASFDLAAIAAPADRRLTRRWLVEAYAALKDGGELLIAGANDHGIRSAIADATTLFGSAHVLAYKHGNRVAQARKAHDKAPEADWAHTAGIAPGTWHEFLAQARDHSFHLRSLPGVFAYDRIDEGTTLLLEVLAVPAGGRMLDVGCGHGMIGLVAARLGAGEVDMVDANILAVAAAGENIARNCIANARAVPSDGVPESAERHYDVVATNPPFHIGKAVDYDTARTFIERARMALKPGGRLILVANQFIRYEPLLRSVFGQVECLAATRSYRVWGAT